MCEEKLLAFFNLDKDNPMDSSLLKGLMWFDICVTVFIILELLFLYNMKLGVINLVIISGFILIDIVFAVWLTQIKIPPKTFLYSVVVLATSSLKLIYGSFVFAILENINISVWYASIIIFFATLTLLNVRRRNKYFNDLKHLSIKETREKWDKKNKGIGLFVLPISTTASISFLLSRVTSRTVQIDLSFILWTLACIWLFIMILYLQSFIIAKKYKIADIFSNQK